MSFLVRRKKVAKTAEVNAAPAPAVSGEQSDKSAKFKERPPQFKNQKVFARIVLSSAVFIIVYFTSSKEKTTTLAGIKETLSLREHKVECSPETFSSDEIGKSLTCIPSHCGRFASDNVISETELMKLKELTAEIFNKIFKDDKESSLAVDLHSEVLGKHEMLSKNVDEVLKALQPKLIDTISQRFVASHNSVKLSSPSYISKVTNVTTEYSERLHHVHYDTEVSKSVHYTLIIYLGSFNKHFSGGKFIFVDTENQRKKHVVVEGKAGRTIGYTAGSENLHFLEKVVTGANYFITLSFTCDKAEDKTVNKA